ncbi:hypothetical protein OG218_00210 [Kineococcus sp. NBC_00420]|uniref:hypothetical protein n=1 Tax=Kineococcus sp. NBC_00420 TaxID=2903564 RepID=UPI002E1A6060
MITLGRTGYARPSSKASWTSRQEGRSMRTTRTPPLLAAVVAAAVTFTVTACSSVDTSTGFGLPQLQDVTGLDITTSALQGVLHVTDQGCFTLDVLAPIDQAADGLWIVWPDDAAQDDKTVNLPGDVELTEDSRISASGMILALNDLPQGSDKNSKIGSFGRLCGADTSDVVVLQDVADA